MAVEEYPKRDPFHAHRLCRLMAKTCLANQIGADACYLVIQIAHVEDAKRYKGPVTFWNEQLMPICGFRSWGAIDRARKAAVKAGWLYYKAGTKSTAATYWTLIPKSAGGLNDNPVDEDSPPFMEDNTEGNMEENMEENTGSIRDQSVINPSRMRSANGEHSTLNPSPIPGPPPASAARTRAVFVIPTVQNVAEYCRERSNKVDPERFIAFYESNGWKVGKNPMKDWKAAVRTWEKNGLDNSISGSLFGKEKLTPAQTAARALNEWNAERAAENDQR